MSTIEVFAAVTGALAVWLTTRQHIWNWPIGLVSVVLYIVVFHDAKLYSDMVLQFIYVILQIYGWYNWLHGGKGRGELTVSTLPRKEMWWWMALAASATGVWGFLMHRYTDAQAVYPDAFIAVLSLISQWLMTRKKLESWYGWLIVDVVAVFVYWYKDLYVTVALYALFLVLASIGAREWQRSIRTQGA